MRSTKSRTEKRGEEMKQYRQKEYGGKWDSKQQYRYHKRKKKDYYDEKTTYPWKNQHKTIRST